jgi:hypothetical protein
MESKPVKVLGRPAKTDAQVIGFGASPMLSSNIKIKGRCFMLEITIFEVRKIIKYLESKGIPDDLGNLYLKLVSYSKKPKKKYNSGRMGRPSFIVTKKFTSDCVKYNSSKKPLIDILKEHDISKSTFYRYRAKMGS